MHVPSGTAAALLYVYKTTCTFMALISTSSLRGGASTAGQVQPRELEEVQPQRLSREDEGCMMHQATCHQPGIIKRKILMISPSSLNYHITVPQEL